MGSHLNQAIWYFVTCLAYPFETRKNVNCSSASHSLLVISAFIITQKVIWWCCFGLSCWNIDFIKQFDSVIYGQEFEPTSEFWHQKLLPHLHKCDTVMVFLAAISGQEMGIISGRCALFFSVISCAKKSNQCGVQSKTYGGHEKYYFIIMEIPGHQTERKIIPCLLLHSKNGRASSKGYLQCDQQACM